MEAFGIDIAKVTKVLLADGWHEVRPGDFVIGPLAYAGWVDRPRKQEGFDAGFPGDWVRELHHVLGEDAVFRGFSFYEPATGTHVYGPLSSILAVGTEDEAMNAIGHFRVIKPDGTVRMPGETGG